MHLPSEVVVRRKTGFRISIFSFSEACVGVTTKGLKYPLLDHTLTQGYPLGVSNEFTEDVARISFESGVLLVILSKD
jgi:thiamine pyrophosphokinase